MSRADLPHVSQSMMPLIVGLFALLADTIPGWVALALLFGFGSGVTVLAVHPSVQRRLHPQDYVRADVAGAWLWLPRAQAEFLDALRPVVAARLGTADNSMLATPTLVTLYPILGRRSPVYDTYCIYPASLEDQTRMLLEIDETQVRLALIDDNAVDGREHLRFSRTHPLVWSRLCAEFSPLKLPALPPNHHLFVRGQELG
jgi:hypothetical protein